MTIAGPDLLGGPKKEGLFGKKAWGYERLFGETGEFVKWAQTAAMMEIVHSLVGEWRVFFCLVFGGFGWERGVWV